MSPLPSAHAQTQFALTRQADLRSAESGERVGVRGLRFCRTCRYAQPPHRPFGPPSPQRGEGYCANAGVLNGRPQVAGAGLAAGARPSVGTSSAAPRQSSPAMKKAGR
ncbi:hypothetical protein FW320_21785 [Azospirillum sp. Vi22]|nr:hypothetical protein [Azospirillum baldaniorum]